MIKATLISTLIQFSGDYKAQFQFDGKLGVFISGQPVITEPKGNQDCELAARFDLTHVKEKIQKSAPDFKKGDLKVIFRLVCDVDKQKTEITLSPEYVRLSDMKTLSDVVFISKKYPKNQFKILDLSF